MKKNREAQDHSNKLTRQWKKRNPGKHKSLNNHWHHKNKVRIKIEVLTHYGKKGKLQCNWKDCEINDLDLLTLDHIKNNGAKHRGSGGHGGHTLYYKLLRDKFPKGFQTLCWNHQWKKELNRRRSLLEWRKDLKNS